MDDRRHRERYERGHDPARVLALSDGVFAIVLTLLVLEIHVPDLAQGQTLRRCAAGGPALLHRLPDQLRRRGHRLGRSPRPVRADRAHRPRPGLAQHPLPAAPVHPALWRLSHRPLRRGTGRPPDVRHPPRRDCPHAAGHLVVRDRAVPSPGGPGERAVPAGGVASWRFPRYPTRLPSSSPPSPTASLVIYGPCPSSTSSRSRLRGPPRRRDRPSRTLHEQELSHVDAGSPDTADETDPERSLD